MEEPVQLSRIVSHQLNIRRLFLKPQGLRISLTDSKGGTHETIDKSEIHEPSVQRKRDILLRSDRNSTRHENLAGISHNPLLGMWVLGLVTFCVLFTDSYGGVARIAILFRPEGVLSGHF